MLYTVDKAVFDLNQDIICGILIGKDLKISDTTEDDEKRLRDAENKMREKYKVEQVRELSNVDLYRDIMRKACINPNKFPPSVEAMFKRILKGGKLPIINALVDLCNAVSIEQIISLGAHDLNDINEDLEVRFSKEGDIFLPFGESEYEKVDEDGNGPLDITINSSPLKEGHLQIQGRSKHWQVILEYTILKDKIHAIGEFTYLGSTSPKEVEYDFIMYEMEIEKLKTMGGFGLKGLHGTKNFYGGNHGQVEIDIIEEGINKATMDLKWKDQGRIITEKIEFGTVSSSTSTIGGVDGPDNISITTFDNGIDADNKESSLPENFIMVDTTEWPQNEYTTKIPPPESGELLFGLIEPVQEYCHLQLSDITKKESEQYVKDLKEVGFMEVEKVSEEINDDYLSVGILLKYNNTFISMAYMDDSLSMYIKLD